MPGFPWNTTKFCPLFWARSQRRAGRNSGAEAALPKAGKKIFRRAKILFDIALSCGMMIAESAPERRGMQNQRVNLTGGHLGYEL